MKESIALTTSQEQKQIDDLNLQMAQMTGIPPPPLPPHTAHRHLETLPTLQSEDEDLSSSDNESEAQQKRNNLYRNQMKKSKKLLKQ